MWEVAGPSVPRDVGAQSGYGRALRIPTIDDFGCSQMRSLQMPHSHFWKLPG